MDNQELIKTIEELKKAGFIYNDSDFCRKLGFPKSFLSEMKAGKKTITEQTVLRIKDAIMRVLGGEEEKRDWDAVVSRLDRIVELLEVLTGKEVGDGCR